MSACVSCGEDLPDGARFCFSCGAAQTKPGCVSCGEDLVAGARFCFSCGAPAAGPAPGSAARPAAPVASRRVTSVLFGDLVGFTTLSETRDQEDVRELLSRYFEECRRVIARYGGMVEKFIGDAVMAVWGVPTAHEDDAERAVRAGLELVDAVASLGETVGAPGLAMRVGLVTGEVAVTVGATHQGMVAGDAVNTAARVQSAATPGQVWVDETTRLLTASAITYVDVGSHALKGKADPVPLWAVRAVVAAMGGAQRADGLEAPIVGRDRELRQTKDLFHAAQETARPLLLVVEGDGGVGKTRLAWEFEKYTDGLSDGVLWHSGRCLAYGEGVAFFALAEAFRGRLRSADDPGGTDDAEDEATMLERGLARLVPDDDERAWLQPRVGALLGIGSVGSFAREDLFSAWTTFLERAGDGDPVVLLIDDAQHADEGLLQFVEHLLLAAGFACFVVLLTRPGLLEARPGLAVNRRASVVHLEGLSAPDMGTLLDGLVAGLPAGMRDQLVARAEGVPLYAVETVRSLVDRDLVVPRGGQYVLADGVDPDLGDLAAPASLQALIAARLDTLTTDQRRVVDRAAVVGESFSADTVAALSDDVADVPAVLVGLLHQQILAQETRRFSGEFGQYRFVQSVVRQVAYGRLSRRDRKALHLAVAARMETTSETADVAAVVAQHYLDAADAVPGDPDVVALRGSAVSHLERAADRAAGLGGPNEAAAHLAVALPLVDDPARLGALEAAMAQALFRAGRYEESCRHAEEAERLLVETGDRFAAATVAVVRSRALGVGLRDNEAAEAAVASWWAELKDRPDGLVARYELCSALVDAQGRRGHNDLVLHEQQVQLAARSGDSRLVSTAYSSMGIYFGATGVLHLSRLLLEASADLARRNHDPDSLARTLNNLAADSLLEDLDGAVDFGTEGSAVSSAAGLSAWGSYADVNLIMALFSRGDWDTVAAMLRDEERRPEDANLYVWGLVSGLLARAAGADPVMVVPDAEAVVLAGDSVDVAWVRACEALAATDRGDLRDASRLALEAVEVQHAFSGIWDDLAFLWPFAADLALAAGADDSLAVLAALAQPEEEGTLVPLALRAHGARTAGVLAARDGDQDRAEQLLREAVADFATWGSVPYGARAALDLAATLDALGRPDEARTFRGPAVAELDRIGAREWLEQAAVPAR